MKFNVRDTLSSDLPYSRAIKGFGENKIEAWEIADRTSFDFAVRELFMANQKDVGGIDFLKTPTEDQINAVVKISNSDISNGEKQKIILIYHNGEVVVKAGLGDIFTVERKTVEDFAEAIEQFWFDTGEYEQKDGSRLIWLADSTDRREVRKNLVNLLKNKSSVELLANYFADRSDEYDGGSDEGKRVNKIALDLTKLWRFFSIV